MIKISLLILDFRKEKRENTEKIVKSEPPIYNCVTSCQNPITWVEFGDYNFGYGKLIPPLTRVWHYYFAMNEYYWVHRLYVFFLHTIPGYIIDMLLMLVGQKPMYEKLKIFLF